MEIQEKRVFVSGGSGVIGKALVRLLDAAGAKVFVGDLKPLPAEFAPGIRYRQGDLNYISPEELAAFAPQVFYHLAATFERSVENYDFWEENFHHNLRLSHHLMTCLKDSASLERVVFASSYLIYDADNYFFGEPATHGTRLKEKASIRPRNICGAAKLFHEIELDFLARFRPFKTASARIYRVYGKNTNDVISRWVRMLLQGETLEVYNKEGLFDYVYFEDVARGLLEILRHDVQGIVNLGRDDARRIADVLELLREYFPGMSVRQVTPLEQLPYEASQANMERFHALTGWMPERRLEDAIPEIIHFERTVGYSSAKERENFGILITSASRKVPLLEAVRAASKKLGNTGPVIAGDLDPTSLVRHFADEFWQMPRLSELDLETLVVECRRRGIQCIVPTRDAELGFFARAKEMLAAAGIAVLVSPIDGVSLCNDKLAFARKLTALGAIVASENPVGLSAPLVVKERFGAGSRSLGLKLSVTQAEAWARQLQVPIFQPFVAGQEYSVDLYVDARGVLKGHVARTRDLVVDGESQVTTTAEVPAIDQVVAKLVQLLPLRGHAVLQGILGLDGRFQLIECNPRFGGASTLSLAAGLDSFYWALLEARGNSLDDYPFLPVALPLRQARYLADRTFSV